MEKQNDRHRLEAFEIWGYRSMLKIDWMDRVTNKEVLEWISEEMQLWKSIVRKRNERMDHIIHAGLLKLIIEDKNYRGSPKLEYIRQIMKDQGCDSYVQMKIKTDYRKTGRWL